MSSINLPDGGFLNLSEQAHPLRLYRAHGGAQLQLRIGFASNKPIDSPLMVSAVLHAGGAGLHHELPELCRLTCQSLINPMPQTNPYVFSGFVSDQALAALEQARAGATLQLELRNLAAVIVDGTSTPPRLHSAPTGPALAVTIPAGVWAEELERVTAASYLEILVPVTDDKEVASANAHLRTARAYLTEGKVKASPTEIRQALDAVRVAYGTQGALAAVLAKRARERSVEERMVMQVETAYSTLSAFIHEDDEAVAGAEVDRPLAIALLAQVAGLVARFAADRRAGRV